ncbi:MAG: hypothetical protein PUB18_05685 [bacterium]|nr:hypothetical protein [bacterium]
MPYKYTGNYVEDLLYYYFSVKNIKGGKYLESIMDKYLLHYSMSIHNAIYYLFGMNRDWFYATDSRYIFNML